MSCSVNGIKSAIEKYTPSILISSPSNNNTNMDAIIKQLSRDTVHSILKDKGIEDSVKQHIRTVMDTDDEIPILENISLAEPCQNINCKDGYTKDGKVCPSCDANKRSLLSLKRQMVEIFKDNGDGEGTTYQADIIYELPPKALMTNLPKQRVYVR